jgi:hypothetical protein
MWLYFWLCGHWSPLDPENICALEGHTLECQRESFHGPVCGLIGSIRAAWESSGRILVMTRGGMILAFSEGEQR